MDHWAHMQTLLPLRSCFLPCLSLERMLTQNISHENDLIFKRINVQVTCIFIYEWFGTKTRFARGKSELFIHELLREPLI